MNRIADWLETHASTPAYSGWLLIGLSCCFLAAAINTMAGWLYVLSGAILAVLFVGAILPLRSLKGIYTRRQAIVPVSAGEELTIELELENQTSQPKTLLQVQDVLPFILDKPVQVAIDAIPPGDRYRWVYYQPTQQRGVYRWQTVQLRSAAPLGLFWCRRQQQVAASAIVYPPILPLTICPLIDAIGQENDRQLFSRERRVQLATEGLTRSLRPYRKGDPIRLIHWRTSARYGELRVRELETITSKQEIIIALDSAATWQPEAFEQAVIATASLYFYAQRQQLNVKLWTAATDIIQGDRAVLHALAATHFEEVARNLPPTPVIWLTQNASSISKLPAGSRWLLWQVNSSQPESLNRTPGILLQTDVSLQQQLQAPLD